MTFYLLGMSAEAPIVATETAVLILAVVGLILLARSVLTLRSEVNALKRSSPGAPSALGSPKEGTSISSPREIPPQVRAAIAAAIFATLGSRHRVVAISPVPSLIWSREGRRQVFDSHRFR